MKTLNQPIQKNLLFLTLIIGISGWLACGNAKAASQTWSGGSGSDGNWSDTSNWLGGAAPGSTSAVNSADIATFNTAIANTWGNSAANPVVIDSATQNIKGISFDTAAGNYFIGSTGGHSLLLTSTGTIQILSTLTSANATETINAPLTLEPASGTTAGTYTFTNNASSGNLLNFGGNITGGTTTSTGITLTLNGSNTGLNTISGIISDASGTVGVGVNQTSITKSGTGTWVLNNANTYTGATLVSAGTLTVGSSGVINAGTNQKGLTVSAGATFNVNGAVTFDNTSTLSGTVNLNSGGTWAQNAQNPNITLGVSAGTTTGVMFTEANGGTVENGLGTTSFQVNLNAGQVILDGANSFTGTSKIFTGSSLLIDMNAGATFTTAPAFTLSGGTLTVKGKASGSTALSLGAFQANISGAQSSLVINPSTGTGTTLSFVSFNPHASTGSLLNITLPTGATLDVTSSTSPTVVDGALQGSIVNGTDFGAVTGSSGAYSIVAASTYNNLTSGTYTSNTTSPSRINSSTPSTVNVASNATMGSLLDNDSAAHAITFGGSGTTLNVTAKSMIFTTSAAGGLTIGTTATPGNVTTSAAGELQLVNNSTTADTMNSAIVNGVGAVILSTGGTGTWVLAGANTYTGQTIVGGGTLEFAKEASLYNGATASWTSANIIVNTGATLAVAVDNSGGSGGSGLFTVGDVNTLLTGMGTQSVSAGFEYGTNIGFDTTNATGGNFNYTDTIANTYSGSNLGVVKLGTNSLTLSNATGNTYSGGTTVNLGTLVATNTTGSATGSGALAVARGAALAGTGTSSGTSFAIGGTTGSGTASVFVGQTAATGDTNTTNKLTLLGSGASTIANAKLTFNLDTTSPGTSPGLGNELLVGGTAITFGSGTAGSNPVTLTLNLQGGQNVTTVPYFVLIAGTAGNGTLASTQYSGLSFGTSFAADGGLLTPILNSSVGGSGNLILALNLNGSTSFYNGQAGLFLFQTAGGIDDIIVIPEPSTWAMMLGGLALLVFWQRRKANLA